MNKNATRISEGDRERRQQKVKERKDVHCTSALKPLSHGFRIPQVSESQETRQEKATDL